MDGLDALSTTYLPTVEPARPVSRPPRYTKEFSATLPPLKRPPVNLRRGPPTCILAHLLTPHDCHVHQWGSSDSKIFSFRTNRHRVAIFLVSFRTLKHLLEKRPWKIKGTCGLLPVFQILLLGFMCANPVNRDEQLSVGHVSRLFRASLLFFLFILSVFFPCRTRLSSSWLPRTTFVLSVWSYTRVAIVTIQGRETLRKGFLKGHGRRFLTRVLPLFLPRFVDTGI